MRKCHLHGLKFDEAYIVRNYFLARMKGQNIFYAFDISQDVRTHSFIEIKTMREPTQLEGRQAFSAVDQGGSFLAMSDNSYLTVWRIDKM